MTNWRRALARSFGWQATAAVVAPSPGQVTSAKEEERKEDSLSRSRVGDMYVWWVLVGAAGFAAGIAAATLIRNSSK